MGLLGKTLPWLLAKGSSAVGWLKGAGMAAIGATGLAGGAAVVDIAANDGEITGGVVEKAGGWWNKTINPLSADLDNTEEILQEQAKSMSWFNSINGWFAGLCEFLGFDKGAEFFKGRMEDTMKDVRGHIDAQRAVLSGVDKDAPTGPNATDPNASVIDAGDVSFGSAFASAGYGIETGIVSMGTGLTALVSGSYEALTTDKGWGASISDDYNAQSTTAMNFLESVHGKPVMDTPLERNLATGGEFASWLIPAGLAAKATGSIVSGLANAGKVEPALGFQAPKMLLN
jgi:hypothetical protein